MAQASAVPDLLAPGLRAVMVGINPGRVSAAAGSHFANPRNDFWRLLAESGLTNAALRTTPGSGDLRRADFAGSLGRLERIERELRPGGFAFVGKEAYRGVFGARAAHGLQEATLGSAWLFVLPSTSPANAAVPYAERLRWFTALADLLRGTTGSHPVVPPEAATGRPARD